MSELLADHRRNKLRRMTMEELDRLNAKLRGKGIHFATQERIDVCKEKAIRLERIFEAARQGE